jgi:hypothetical protein
MNTRPVPSFLTCAWLTVAIALLLPGVGHADELTALAAVKEGNRHVGEHVQNKVLRIRSEKSVGGLSPNIWIVDYLDSTARGKITQVKIGAGRMLDVRRPFRVGSTDAALDLDKLKVDSDRAIKVATADPLLDKLTVTATQLELDRNKEFGVIWKVSIWASKLQKPTAQAGLGEVWVSADEGKIVKTNLRVNRVG